MSPYLIPEQLERNSPQPLYNQIYEQLKRELVLGGHKEGERFYSYRKLSEIYKTELRTIASAIELLIDDGLLKKKANSGIYVHKQEKFSGVGNVWYAVLADQHYHPFFFNVLVGLINEAEKYGLRVVVRFGENQEELLHWFVPHPGEGLILAGNINDALVKEAGAKCNNNLILVGNYELQGDFGTVTTNCYGGICKALKTAMNRGCRKVALITGSGKFLISRTLLQAVQECSEEFNADFLHVEETSENGYTAMHKTIEFQPDCILLTEPAFAGVWEYMQEHHLRCPDDLFLIRYGKEKNDNNLAGRAAIDLESDSVIHGKTAIQMLLKNKKDIIKVEMNLKQNKF